MEVYVVRTDLLRTLLAEEHGDVDRDAVGEGDVDTLEEILILGDGVREMNDVREDVTVKVCKIEDVEVVDEHADTEGDTVLDMDKREV